MTIGARKCSRAALHYMDGGVGGSHDKEGCGNWRKLRQQVLPQSCHQKGCGDVGFHYDSWLYIVASRRREGGGDRQTLLQQVLSRATWRVAEHRFQLRLRFVHRGIALQE